jgi:hypothetical protein
MEQCHERIHNIKTGVHIIKLGALLVRGDNIIRIGELDHEVDASIDLNELQVEPIKLISQQL